MDVFLGFWVFAGEFLAEGEDLVVDRAGGRHFVITPYIFEELSTTHDLAFVTYEKLENLKFFGSMLARTHFLST